MNKRKVALMVVVIAMMVMSVIFVVGKKVRKNDNAPQKTAKPTIEEEVAVTKAPQTKAPATKEAAVTKAPQTKAPATKEAAVTKVPQTKAPASKKPAQKKNTTSKKPSQKGKSATPLKKHGKLKVKGTKLVDKNGDEFALKGISTHGIAWFPQYINKDAFSTVKSWGANAVRLAMYSSEYGGYCTGGDTDNLLKMIDNGVSYATSLGMYVIIDWHILSDGNPQTYKSSAISFFKDVSKKYKNNDNVIYEICNEPNGCSWQDVKSYADEVIPVIRKNAPDSIIIVGTPTWSQDVDQVSANPVKKPHNVMYACHFYAATHGQYLRDKVKTALDNGTAVFISEFGICDASGNGGINYDEASAWLKFINDNKLSCMMWNMSNKAETCSIISSSCDKVAGWKERDLTDSGKWFKNKMLAKMNN